MREAGRKPVPDGNKMLSSLIGYNPVISDRKHDENSWRRVRKTTEKSCLASSPSPSTTGNRLYRSSDERDLSCQVNRRHDKNGAAGKTG